MKIAHRLPTLSGMDVAKVLCREGFEQRRQKGSHMRFVKVEPKAVFSVTIPGNQKDLKKGTLMGILQQAGLSKEKFLRLLSA
ncbi:type II toxin-antitoxin system HicA family toxin [Heliorestis convoluta]|uniref:Addiction module toxin, HicA family n=1 Tax=Heliorestis convoluta TaxID=356322 RepID=A0A5Q2MYY7_9FIRM|nr:type II toxin-antitoxin system HicA family toxin [Heliorestis convoluta]QGG47877.1 addiction module toxin, HicA family [Heliorestis convoluta]